MLTTDFVAAVRRQGSIPANYLSSDILAQGDLEIQSVFIPLLERLRQNYFIRELTASPDSRGRVPLPARAVGGALRSVQLQVGNVWVPLPQRAMEDADSVVGGQPFAYYLDAGSVVLLPNGSSGTLRIRYAARPGKMVLDTDATKASVITAVSVGASVTTLTSTYSGGGTVDVISSGPAHQQKVIGATFGSILNTDCTETPIVGDYLVTADRSPLVPLPEELSSALMHRTAGVIVGAEGYLEEGNAQLGLAENAIQRCIPMLSPRNEGNAPRITGGIRRALGMRNGGRRLY